MIYENIRYLAKENGIRMSDVERAVGVSTGYFSRLKAREKSIPIGYLLTVCFLFNVPLEYLCTVNIVKQAKITKLTAELERLRGE